MPTSLANEIIDLAFHIAIIVIVVGILWNVVKSFFD